MRKPLAFIIASCALLAANAGQAQAPQNIGVAATVVNKMEGTVATQKRVIGKGDKVFRDEVVETGADGKGQLLFVDETALTVGPNSRVTLDNFVYNPKGQSTVVLSATKGVLRFVSGSLPSQAYEIKTPAGSIGVRGTIFNVIIALNGDVTLYLREGMVVWHTIEFGDLFLDRAGQIVTVRKGGPKPAIVTSLTDAQIALLQPIEEFGVGGDKLPDGKTKADELRDTTRGKPPASKGSSD